MQPTGDPPPQAVALSQSLPGKVFFRDSDEYNKSIGSYHRAQEREIKPEAVVCPESREDVAEVVKTLVKADADGQACKFAVRGGGHTLWSAASNVAGGITIDMRRMDEVNVSEDRTIARIGSGAIWKNVYRKLDSMGLAVVGGRSGEVGVAGLTLGGGISYFSAQRGFACDNVVNYEIVLASGEIVNANANERADIWRALKGGSKSFGIVTRLDLVAFPYEGIFGGMVIFDESKTPQMLKAFADLNSKTDFDKHASLMHGFSMVSSQGHMWSPNLHYTKPVENPETFEAFTSLEPKLFNNLRITKQAEFVEEFSAYNPGGQRAYFITHTVASDLDFLTAAYAHFKEMTTPFLSMPSGRSISLTMQPISVPMLEASAARGENMFGISASEGPLALLLISAMWPDPADDESFEAVGKAMSAWIVSKGAEAGVLNDFIYLNYASSFQAAFSGYGKDNLEFMQEVSRKYDPNGLFQRSGPGLNLFEV